MGFHVGQKVVCVDDSLADDGRSPLVTSGQIYTIEHAYDSLVGPGVRLVEVAPYADKQGWRADRFRPITERETDISVFTAMLIGAPNVRERVE